MTETLPRAQSDDVEHPPAPGRRARWWLRAALVVVLAVAGAGAAFAVAVNQPEVHAARSEILYEADGTSTSVTDRELATQQALLRSRAVLGPVAESAGLSGTDLEDATTVEQIGASELLELTVEHRNADQALAMAEEIVERYVSRVNEEGEARGGQVAELIEAEIVTLEEQLTGVEEQIGALEAAHQQARAADPAAQAPPDLGRMQREAQTLGQRVAELESRLTDLRIDQLGDPKVSVVTAPYLLDEPVSPRPVQSGAAGALVGLAIAAGVLLLLNQLRPARD